MRRPTLVLILAAALLTLASCDQFFPYEQESVRVCSAVDTTYANDGSGVIVGIVQVCWTEGRRVD